ncbi:MAG: hypothetical protein EBQ58_14265 [Betaproteobacteria bacterium]|nr:hypothetical protein [Betaproteobacteria bacterium]
MRAEGLDHVKASKKSYNKSMTQAATLAGNTLNPTAHQVWVVYFRKSATMTRVGLASIYTQIAKFHNERLRKLKIKFLNQIFQ